MSIVPSTVEQPPIEQPPVAGHRPARSGAEASWLILCCYLLAAVAVTWRLWVDPTGRMQAGDIQDVNLFAWFLRYSATAVSHGHLPALFTTALNAPRGVNMMWNTSFLLPGIVLTPVTLLAGPQVSLTIVLTVAIAGSAASLFWVLRRWGASVPAAALGGAVYGFSPAMLNSGTGHYQLVFAVLPPLIIDAVLRIVTGHRPAGRGGRPRGTPVDALRTGVWLGLLTAAQVFIGEEMLTYTAVASVVLVLVAALGHPRAVPGRVRDTVLGAVTGAVVALLISGYPLWVQFHGPLREQAILFGSWSGNLAFFVDPSGNLLFHSNSSAAVVAGYNLGLPEVLAYLGWPLIVVLLAAAIRFWRDPRVRAAAVTCAVLELCNLGGGELTIGRFRLSGSFLPFHWIQDLPTMAQVLPDRFCILGAGAAGAVLAFSLDLTRSSPRPARAWQRSIPAAVAVLAILPLIPLPYQSSPVPAVPAGWQAAFTRLRLAPDDRVLVVPITLIAHTEVMRWQADTGEPGSMIGGYFSGPGRVGQPSFFAMGPSNIHAAQYLNLLWARKARVDRSSTALVRSALAYWRPAAVVAITEPGSRLGQFLTSLLGRPSFHIGRVLAWRLQPHRARLVAQPRLSPSTQHRPGLGDLRDARVRDWR